ncbi:MAG: hypothetical protein EBS74_00910 [Flavobacteriia bacterium]|nr:hypothetical protein [Flavobacteriia bacterium]
MICVKPQKINMKLKSTAFLLYLLFFSWVNAQLHPSAAFQISSTTQGFLLPQMTQSQMDNISNPADGLMIYCSDCSTGNGTYVFNAKKKNWANSTGGVYEKDGQLSQDRNVNLTSSELCFISDSGSTTLVVDGQNNRVGIGTSTPTATLDVDGNSNFQGIISTNGHWISGDGDQEAIMIGGNGNIGVGTATPSTIFEINSTENGILIPRISLTASATYGLAGTATESMLVYNTNTATNTGLNGKGFYYWSSETATGSWVKIGSGGGDSFYAMDDTLTNSRKVGMGENLLVLDGNNGSLKLNSSTGTNKDVVKNSGIGSP